jgi:hypothetical protein
MMSRCILVLVLCGCGRLGFDLSGDQTDALPRPDDATSIDAPRLALDAGQCPSGYQHAGAGGYRWPLGTDRDELGSGVDELPTALARRIDQCRESRCAGPDRGLHCIAAMTKLAGFALAGALGVSACTTTPSTEADEPGTSSVVLFDTGNDSGPPIADVLFVVDDSKAMTPYRDHVLASAQSFADAMVDPAFRYPSLHVGVVTTDPHELGVMRRPPGSMGPYLVDVSEADGTRTRNYPGPFASALAAMLDVGAGVDGPIEPLEAVRRALADHPDFVRLGSFLFVVVIAARDDASPDSPDTYASFLRGLQYRLWFAGIEPGPLTRLDAVGAQFPYHGVTPLDGSLGAALSGFARLKWSLLTCACVKPPLDIDPQTPGPQYDCNVFVTLDGRDGTFDLPLPACPAAGPCWTLEPGCCATFGDGLQPTVSGLGLYYYPRIFGQCARPTVE